MLRRQDGRQRSLTFENLPAAERFKTLLEDHGPDEALRIIELDEVGRHVPTVSEWLHRQSDRREVRCDNYAGRSNGGSPKQVVANVQNQRPSV